MTDIRLIVCFDLDQETPDAAYAELERRINGCGVAWETSDEWYDSDGEQGDPDVLQTAIVAHFKANKKTPSLRERIGAILGTVNSRCLDDDDDFAAVRDALVEGLGIVRAEE